ncbi:MAG: TIGR03086 family metal-binding protein [Nocardioides sp.]|uniref:TIGR03086 family metal-binding protein n=1 Tax=Nocardioides sp. TaxID=35761 RepID=UPI003F097E36
MTYAQRHRTLAANFTRIVEGVTDWDAPTPVAEWRARDVVGHLASWLPGFLSGGSEVEIAPGPGVEDDPVGAWTHLREQVQGVLETPALAAAAYDNPHTGRSTVEAAVDQFYTNDVFMHAWDLARASGQADGMDEAVCEATLNGMEPAEEMLRASGQFGVRQPVEASAPASERLAAFLGRDPHWAPPA